MCSAAEVLPVLWGRQSCLQPPFQTALLDMRESSIPAAPAESRRQPGLAAPQSSAYSLFCLPQTTSVGALQSEPRPSGSVRVGDNPRRQTLPDGEREREGAG